MDLKNMTLYRILEQSRAEQINLFFLAYANAIITGLQSARYPQQFRCGYRALFRAPAHEKARFQRAEARP